MDELDMTVDENGNIVINDPVEVTATRIEPVSYVGLIILGVVLTYYWNR